MTDWTAGYVSDIEYMPGFYGEQVPAHLDAVCLVRGVEPPVPAGAPFAYCELGSGLGETAAVVAAANPQAEVWAFDFNPAHIARNAEMAALAGLENLHPREAAFADIVADPAPDWPRFDYITMHGVWSWVSAENQAHIVRFIDRFLKPGGLVYVTYNALPGWTDALPLQRLLAEIAATLPGRSDTRIVQALAVAREMSKAGALPLQAEALDRLEQEAERGNTAYLSHEYLNAHWMPCFHADVAAAFAGAKLSFVASANMLENFPDLNLEPEQRAALRAQPEGLRETLKDYFLPRTFRRDIFIRGPRIIPDRRSDERRRAQNLVLAVPHSAVTHDVKVPLGAAHLNDRFYKPAFAAMAEGVRSVGALLDAPEAEGSSASPSEVIGMTVGAKQAMPAPNALDAAAVARVRRFNLAHLQRCAGEGRPNTALAALALGSAVPVRLFEMLVYEVLATGTEEALEPVAAACWQLLKARGDRLRNEGRLIEDEAENLVLLRQELPQVLEVGVPFWRRIGAM